MKPDGTLTFGIDYIAEGLQVPEAIAKEIFQDGRSAGHVLEYRFAPLFGHQRTGGDKDRDLDGPGGKRYEVRAVTHRGATLLPSSMHGAGRKIDAERLGSRINSLSGFVFADVTFFPEVPYWCIPIMIVQKWMRAGDMGKNFTISSHSKMVRLLNDAFYTPLVLENRTN